MSSDYTPDRNDLVRLAEQCERGAEQLRYEAQHAAEVLADRGHSTVQAADWARQKQQAAAAAADYAAGLRREYDALGETGTPTLERFRQAEQVANAANLGGILIDGRPMAERDAQSDSVWHDSGRDAWQAGTHPTQQKAAEVESAGVFTHVAETINGRDQVPFWRLGSQDDLTAGQQQAPGDDDADGM